MLVIFGPRENGARNTTALGVEVILDLTSSSGAPTILPPSLRLRDV
jgi:hypothetical protein